MLEVELVGKKVQNLTKTFRPRHQLRQPQDAKASEKMNFSMDSGNVRKEVPDETADEVQALTERTYPANEEESFVN